MIPSVKGVRVPTVPERAMIARGMDYADVSRLAGLSASTIKTYFRRGCVSSVVGEDLAKIVGVDPEWFADGWREEQTERATRGSRGGRCGLKLRLV